MNNKTALVTGAAGFIGSRLVAALLANDWSVVGLDTFDDFYDVRLKASNVAGISEHPRFALNTTDIRETASVIELCSRDVDVIVHLAALAGVRPSAERASDYMDVNVAGTASLLEVMRARSIPHMVFASSSSVYGLNPDVPWIEDAHLGPISVYAGTKLAGERLLAGAAERWGFSSVATRIFTAYGPGQRPDLAITNFASRMLRGQPIPIYGDGSARRDFTFVDDIVDGIRRAVEYRAAPFMPINLARGEQSVLIDVVRALEQVLDIEARIEFSGPINGDVPQTWGSISRARSELDYRPSTDLIDGLRASVPWFHQVADLGAALQSSAH